MQAAILDQLCFHAVSGDEIDLAEISEKENFRMEIHRIIRETITRHEVEQSQQSGFPPLSVELQCFGSLSSGFATKASDMDLALLSPLSMVQPQDKGSPIPRLIEKALLDAGFAARLLAKTRVPIIKLCQNPPESLYKDLLECRTKWERGEEEDDHDDDEDHDNDHEASPDSIETSNEKKAPSTNETHDAATASKEKKEFQVPSIDGSSEIRTLYLHQGPATSLQGYLGLAKRVLRKAGMRDVRSPATLSETQWEILNRICEAYVDGLADPSLRQRLRGYPSLAFQPTAYCSDHHSLMGVAAQVEGEHIFQLVEKSAFLPDSHRPKLDLVTQTWRGLLGRPNYGVDPVNYAKDVQIQLDNLKRLPVVQAILLEQTQDETPLQYHVRTNHIMHLLKLNEPLQITLVQQYVDGIRPQDIRVSVKDEITRHPEGLSFGAIARKHKSLHLAREFTRALEKGTIGDEHVADVKEYIRLLQSPLRKTTRGHASFDYVIPLTIQTVNLANRIRDLPDPHLMAPNQPKDKYRDKLEFPKSGAGVQCDINFSAHLALQNTLLLRCYSHADPRVRPMVLFIKHWAKTRGINSGYRGTLSSYGYVLMVLHYLVNVVQPFVCPNLQELAPPPPPDLPPAEVEKYVRFNNYNIQFWRNEEEIKHLAAANQLTRNNESIGNLLRGFFEYYAQTGTLCTVQGKGFDWGREVLSLRTQGGILLKAGKGWTGAKTVYETQNMAASNKPGSEPPATPETAGTSNNKPGGGEVKEVRLRYLFAIEDPFEIDHNVARTVTHNGIVSIRDEFRRAWRLIKFAKDGRMDEDLLKEISQGKPHDAKAFPDLLREIHGPVPFDDDDDNNDS